MRLWNKILDLITVNVFTCIALMSVTFMTHVYIFTYSYLSWGIVILSLFVHLLINQDSLEFKLPKKIIYLISLVVLLGFQILFSQFWNQASLIVGAIYTLKFLVFGLIILLLYASKITTKDIEKTLYFFMIVFFGYYIIGLFFSDFGIIWRDGSGRTHSYLLFPGELCYAGMFFGLFGLSKFLFKMSLKDFLGFCLGVFLIGIDGSRSSLLCFTIVMAFAIILRKEKIYKKIIYFVGTGALIYSLIFILSRNYAGGPNVTGRFEGGVSAFNKVVEPAKITEKASTVGNDSLRTRMIIASKNIILNANLFGHGVKSTSVPEGDKQFVLHLAYVQVLGDYGYIGLLIFVSLIVTQFSLIPFGSLNQGPDYLFMLLIAMIQPMMFLFHPISNEISTHMFLFLVLIVTYKKYQSEKEPDVQIA